MVLFVRLGAEAAATEDAKEHRDALSVVAGNCFVLRLLIIGLEIYVLGNSRKRTGIYNNGVEYNDSDIPLSSTSK